jgi:hypothetical protein
MPCAIVSYENFDDSPCIVQKLYSDYQVCKEDLKLLRSGKFLLPGKHFELRKIKPDTKVGDIV